MILHTFEPYTYSCVLERGYYSRQWAGMNRQAGRPCDVLVLESHLLLVKLLWKPFTRVLLLCTLAVMWKCGVVFNHMMTPVNVLVSWMTPIRYYSTSKHDQNGQNLQTQLFKNSKPKNKSVKVFSQFITPQEASTITRKSHNISTFLQPGLTLNSCVLKLQCMSLSNTSLCVDALY